MSFHFFLYICILKWTQALFIQIQAKLERQLRTQEKLEETERERNGQKPFTQNQTSLTQKKYNEM